MAVADAPVTAPVATPVAAPVAAQVSSPVAGWKPTPAQPTDDLQKTMDDARRKLAEIDALLGETIR
jgi:chemotaxis protein MotC